MSQELVAEQVQQLEVLKQDAGTLHATTQAEIDRLCAECEKLQASLAESTRVKESDAEEIAVLTESSNSFSLQCDNLQVEMNEVNLRFENASQAAERLQASNDDLRTTIENERVTHAEKSAALEEKAESLELSCTALMEEHARMTEEFDTMKSEHASATDQFNGMAEEIRELTAECASKVREIELATAANAVHQRDAQEKFDLLEDEVRHHADAAADKSSEIELLEASAKAAKEHAAALTSMLDTANAAASAARDKFAELDERNREVVTLKFDLDKLTVELDGERNAAAELVATLDAAAAEEAEKQDVLYKNVVYELELLKTDFAAMAEERERLVSCQCACACACCVCCENAVAGFVESNRERHVRTRLLVSRA